MTYQKEAQAKNRTIHDETFAPLLLKNPLIERIRVGKAAYTVETRLKANHKKWYYCSLVTYKGKEIAGDSKLQKAERCRKRAMQSSKAKILWDCFVSEAAAAHLEKVEEIAARREKEFNQKKRSRKCFSPVLIGIAVIVATVYGQYQLDPKLKRGASNERIPHTPTEQPTDILGKNEAKTEKRSSSPALRVADAPGRNSHPSYSLPDVKKPQPAPLPVVLEIANLQRAPDISDPPELVMKVSTDVQTEAQNVTEKQPEGLDLSADEKIWKVSEGSLEPRAATQEAHLPERGIEETVAHLPLPEAEGLTEQQKKDPLKQQQALQTTIPESLEYQEQSLPRQPLTEPEIQRVNHNEAPAANTNPQTVPEGEQQDKTEIPSKEEIRQKIKAILGNSNK